MGILLNSTVDVYELLTLLGFVIVVGMIFGKIFEKFKLPAVTGYIVAGIILGPTLKIITPEVKSGLEILSNIAIAFIAFSIGTELWIPKLKKSGKQIVIITVTQTLVTFLVVLLTLLVFQKPLWMALTLGAIATATAPASIMMIVKRYESKGELTDTLIPVTGLDDATGIIVFGLCLSIATSLSIGAKISIDAAVIEPLLEIFMSVLLGCILGIILGLCAKYYISKQDKGEKRVQYLELIIAVVLISVTIAHFGIPMHGLFGLEKINISSILMPMLSGVVFTNMINKDNYRQQSKAVDLFTSPLLVAFFTLAGADLDFKVLASSAVIITSILYVLARTTGKVSGAYLGSKMSKASPKVKKYLGLTLLPQGGVEIGLVITATAAFKAIGQNDYAATIQTVVIVGIFIFELIGPVMTKHFLERAGEFHYKDPKGEDFHF